MVLLEGGIFYLVSNRKHELHAFVKRGMISYIFIQFLAENHSALGNIYIHFASK